MGSFGVVPDEPGNQTTIELIGVEQELFMIIDKFFLNGSVDAFDVSAHLGCFGLSMPVIFM